MLPSRSPLRFPLAMLALITLPSCGSKASPPHAQPSAPASKARAPAKAARPTTTKAPAPRLNPEVRRLLLTAELVVVGEVSVRACRGGCAGVVRVLKVVSGSTSARELAFVSVPPAGGVTFSPVRALVFLHLDPVNPKQWRLALTSDRRVGLAANRVDELAPSYPLRATRAADRAAFAAELAQLRNHDQTKWNGSTIVTPARRVFGNLDLRGLDQRELAGLIGQPVRRGQVSGRLVWEYTFHDGEQGVMARLWWTKDGKVQQVDIGRTQ